MSTGNDPSQQPELFSPQTNEPMQSTTDDLANNLAMALLRRIVALETQTRIDDPVVDAQPPDTKFQPYSEFYEALPGLQKDFFRHPLPEAARKRFLADCPRNLARQYNAPILNNVNISRPAVRTDNQLSDIQYRLSGITRPLDHFVHRKLQSNGPSKQEAIEFANVVHELLVDTASFITQLRIDNMFAATGIRGQAPKLGSSSTSPLLEPKDMVEYVKTGTSSTTNWTTTSSEQVGKSMFPRSHYIQV